MLASLSIPVLDIKKMVYLYLVNYSRLKPDMAVHAMPGLLNVRCRYSSESTPKLTVGEQDAADRNALVRALAIRTMSYLQAPQVQEALIDPLLHALKDVDPYVRKTAAIAVAKLDRRLLERERIIDRLRDLLGDANPTVVANTVAALIEITERSEHIHLRLNDVVAGRLVSAMTECSEWVARLSSGSGNADGCAQLGPDVYARGADVLRAGAL